MANRKVTELQANQFTIPIGANVKPQNSPTIKVEKISPDAPGQRTNYRLIFSFDVIAEQEFLHDKSNKITGEDTYAVLTVADTTPFSDEKADGFRFNFNVNRIGEADDWQVEIDLNMIVPGTKGDHGN